MRRILLAVALVACIAALGWWLYGRLFGDGAGRAGEARGSISASAPPARAPEDAGAEDGGGAVSATVLDVRGTVQRRTAAGRWQTVARGSQLSLDDRVRTLSGGSLLVKLGDAVQVRLTSRTEVTIRELTREVSRVRIEEGRIVAEVNPQGRTVLRVEARGSDAVAESRGGSFSVISDGRGQVAVATQTGTVKLSARGESVEVGAGQTSRVSGESPPTEPTAVPSSLFLKVAPPKRRVVRTHETVIQGRATPGSLVRVAGRTAQVDAEGRFRVKVPLREGENRIRVHVTDVTGRETSASVPPIVVDTREPKIRDTEVRWGP